VHKKPVKDIQEINNEGRLLGMVTIPYCKGVSEKFRRMCYRYKVRDVLLYSVLNFLLILIHQL
jgi:hypothetical protein